MRYTSFLALLCSLPSLTLALPEAEHAWSPFFYKGFDLSSLKIEEDGGAVYKDTARGNVTRPVEDILGDGGMNVVRLRLWVHPKAPYDGKQCLYEHSIPREC